MKKSEFKWHNGVFTAWDIDELDSSKSIESQAHLLKEDLMQVLFGEAIVLDLGWHPEFDPQGQFIMSVVKSEDWENPVWQLRFRDLSQLPRNLNQAIEIATHHASKQL